MKQPKEIATELTEYFDNPKNNCQTDNAIQCALKVVDEILESYNMANVEYEDGCFKTYWQAVKKELIK